MTDPSKGKRDIITRITTWLAFLWSCSTAYLFVYGTWMVVVDSENEAMALVGWGFIAGIISWIGVPALTFSERKNLHRGWLVFFNIPSAVALLSLLVFLMAEYVFRS